jgi:hypothetical protein
MNRAKCSWCDHGVSDFEAAVVGGSVMHKIMRKPHEEPW